MTNQTTAACEAVCAVIRDSGHVTHRSAISVIRANLDADQRWRLANVAISALDTHDLMAMVDAMAIAAAQGRQKAREPVE
jgi:hypothetical protein